MYYTVTTLGGTQLTDRAATPSDAIDKFYSNKVSKYICRFKFCHLDGTEEKYTHETVPWTVAPTENNNILNMVASNVTHNITIIYNAKHYWTCKDNNIINYKYCSRDECIQHWVEIWNKFLNEPPNNGTDWFVFNTRYRVKIDDMVECLTFIYDKTQSKKKQVPKWLAKQLADYNRDVFLLINKHRW